MDRLLDVFVNETEREFHVRELSKKLKISPTTVSKYLKKMQREGLLLSEKKYNHLFFKANSGSLLFKQKKIQYTLYKIINSGLIEHLEEQLHPHTIAFDTTNNKEEITLIVVSNKKGINIKDFEKKLGKINIFIYSRDDIKHNKELIDKLINGMVIKGGFYLNEN